MASTYVVERKATMNASKDQIFGRIVNLERWGEWSPWDELDPDMQKTFEGNAGEVGSGYRWTGNRKVGEGNVKVTASEPPDRMTADLQFLKPFKSEADVEFTLAESGGGTEVTWTMNATHNFISRVMNLFGMMDRMIGKDFEKGLAKLKSLSEA